MVYNFSDDTAILCTEKDPRRLRKRVNIDLKLLLHWLKANKLYLNVAKTVFLLFKNKRKDVNYDIKIKLDGKRMRFSREVKYLGMISDDNLSVINHKKQLCGRLRKANGALCLALLSQTLCSIPLLKTHLLCSFPTTHIKTKYIKKLESCYTTKNGSTYNHIL